MTDIPATEVERPAGPDLFRAIATQIRNEPASYDQHLYGWKTDLSPCGTVACIGGWAVILGAGWTVTGFDSWADETGRHYRSLDALEDEARDLLGIDELESDKLFSGGMRPRVGDVPDMLDAIADGAHVSDVVEAGG